MNTPKKESKTRNMPNQTIRLSQEDLDYVYNIGRWSSFNESARIMINLVRSMEATGLTDIMGLIQPNEWKFLLRVIDYKTPTCDKNEIIRQVVDPKNTIAFAPLLEVNPKALAITISGFDSVQVFALVERLNNYYQNPGTDEDEWANL